MSSETRRKLTQDVLDKIDDIVGGHELQRSPEFALNVDTQVYTMCSLYRGEPIERAVASALANAHVLDNPDHWRVDDTVWSPVGGRGYYFVLNDDARFDDVPVLHWNDVTGWPNYNENGWLQGEHDDRDDLTVDHLPPRDENGRFTFDTSTRQRMLEEWNTDGFTDHLRRRLMEGARNAPVITDGLFDATAIAEMYGVPPEVLGIETSDERMFPSTE